MKMKYFEGGSRAADEFNRWMDAEPKKIVLGIYPFCSGAVPLGGFFCTYDELEKFSANLQPGISGPFGHAIPVNIPDKEAYEDPWHGEFIPHGSAPIVHMQNGQGTVTV